MLYREGMNGIVLLITVLAVALFVVVIKYSTVTLFMGQATWNSIVHGHSFVDSVCLFIFIARNTKEALYLLAGFSRYTTDFVYFQYLVHH